MHIRFMLFQFTKGFRGRLSTFGEPQRPVLSSKVAVMFCIPTSWFYIDLIATYYGTFQFLPYVISLLHWHCYQPFLLVHAWSPVRFRDPLSPHSPTIT